MLTITAALLLKVYPRVGGGNSTHRLSRSAPSGLSPRGRGKPNQRAPRCEMRGSIPAWAGETPTGYPPIRLDAVYPRVGGGNGGYAPHRRGDRGLSPRGRGKRRPLILSFRRKGSIPAWAGETFRHDHEHGFATVYPRVGGGNRSHTVGGQYGFGLSPRGRGKQIEAYLDGLAQRSIPAWAGETRSAGRSRSRSRVYPRVGGGNLVAEMPIGSGRGLSPRGRGKRADADRPADNAGSIPAWAGET